MTPAPRRVSTPAAAARRLAEADPVMARLVAEHGPPTLARPRRGGPDRSADSHFAALARSVVYQQLAGRAAAAIHGRFVAAVGGESTPGAVLAAGEPALRGAGLSAAKASTILGLASAVHDGRLDLEAVGELEDDEIVAALVALPGIGPWTAQMFCMFTLGRLDVWPVTDYGVRKGWARAYGLAELPTPRALLAEGERHRPYRSVAAWYCWRAAETAVLPVSPPD